MIQLRHVGFEHGRRQLPDAVGRSPSASKVDVGIGIGIGIEVEVEVETKTEREPERETERGTETETQTERRVRTVARLGTRGTPARPDGVRMTRARDSRHAHSLALRRSRWGSGWGNKR